MNRGLNILRNLLLGVSLVVLLLVHWHAFSNIVVAGTNRAAMGRFMGSSLMLGAALVLCGWAENIEMWKNRWRPLYYIVGGFLFVMAMLLAFDTYERFRNAEILSLMTVLLISWIGVAAFMCDVFEDIMKRRKAREKRGRAF